MSVFDIKPDWLEVLSPEDLEYLVYRLCQAEVVSHGGKKTDVRRQGDTNRPDGGVDIRAGASCNDFSSEFLSRKNIILQVKSGEMTAAKIRQEMVFKKVLRNSIADLVNNDGGYIIIGSKGNCPDEKRSKLQGVMADIIQSHLGPNNIPVAYYDGNTLCDWICQHAGVVVLAREMMNQPLEGWSSFEEWGKSQKGAEGKYIMADGVIVKTHSGVPESTKNALGSVRKLVRDSDKPVRVIGLSGVGKTRFVRALFETEYLDNALASHEVIYLDEGSDNPKPNIDTMIKLLHAEKYSAILILDNCSSKLHAQLTKNTYIDGEKIKLITIDYDIVDGQPNSTEVVEMQTTGVQTAMELLFNCKPSLSQATAWRLAKFSDGNAGLSIALADGLDSKVSIANFHDDEIFERLFCQKKKQEVIMIEQEHAEVLSLVYSYSVDENEERISELSTLGSLIDVSAEKLYRTTEQLCQRQIAQKRGEWRAILPHPIANRLARQALTHIRSEKIMETMMEGGNARLLESFAHRLSYLHGSEKAKNIANDLLTKGALLTRTRLDRHKCTVFRYLLIIADVESVIKRVEDEINALARDEDYSDELLTIETLSTLAYEDKYFDKCVSLLINLYEREDRGNIIAEVAITELFRVYCSGTEATLKTRLNVAKKALNSENEKIALIGARMLDHALDHRNEGAIMVFDFSAGDRGFGMWPDRKLLLEWLSSFIDLSASTGCDSARKVLAKRFPYLWEFENLQEKLCTVFTAIGENDFWLDGYSSVRDTIYKEKAKEPQDDDSALSKLNKLLISLQPVELKARILEALHFDGRSLLDEFYEESNASASTQSRENKKAESLGRAFSDEESFADVFAYQHTVMNSTRLISFGYGIACGTSDIEESWKKLLDSISTENVIIVCHVINGFLAKIKETKQELHKAKLDEAVEHDILKDCIVLLHDNRSFNDDDFNRCIKMFDKINHTTSSYSFYGNLFWQDQYKHLQIKKLIELGDKLLLLDNGKEVLLEAICKRIDDDTKLEKGLQRIGLKAAEAAIISLQDVTTHGLTDQIDKMLGACNNNDCNHTEMMALHNAIAKMLETHKARLFIEIVRTAIKVDLEHCLELYFIKDQYGEVRLDRLGDITFSGPKLFDDDVCIERLISWCKKQNYNQAWAHIADYLDIYETVKKERVVNLTERAQRFLEACPFPDQVLEIYVKRICPMRGGRARDFVNVMKSNAMALEKLLKHERQDIVAAAKVAIEKAARNISGAKGREQQNDAIGSKRFE